MFDESHPQFLHPATPEEFLPPLSNWTTLGGIVLLAGFGSAIALSAILKYKVTIKAPGTIRPAGELRLVQSPIAGTIKSIEVEGDRGVKKDEIVAYIDDGRLQTQKSQLQGNIGQLTAQLASVDAQIKAIAQQIAAESDRSNRAIASASAELLRAQREFQDREITSAAEVKEAEANLGLAQKQLQQQRAELKSAEANLRSTAASWQAARKKRDRYQPLVESGSIALDQFEEVQLAVEQQAQATASQTALVEARSQAISQQERAIEAALARLQRASAAQNPTDATVAIAKERVAQEKAAGAATSARLNQELQALMQRQVELQNQLSRDGKELQQTETELQQTAIRASASGIIQELHLRNSGQVVSPGETIAQIAPSEAPLAIKALVSSVDISKVARGQTVQMRVSACPYPDFGTLPGTVTAISPDAIAPEGNDKTVAAGNFQVTIAPESLKLTAPGRECKIQSGMEGRADIISREETVLAFILRKARLLTDL
ncbi:MAG: HlyD family efflux transporter periplasmic adaptor subunit [Hormoscilla sp. GUM202]|nr:HlyD family efflux transporter periplasmic adaptor subunit [Hormoscilla sp. GUM202]